MMNRRLLHSALAVAMAGSLAACGSSSNSKSTTAPTTAAAAATAAPAAPAATTAAAPAAAATTAAPAATTAPAATGAGPTTTFDNAYPVPPTDAATTTATPTTAAAAATTAAGSAAPAAASLSLATDPQLGPIVVDAQGFTLYLFTKDTSTTSVCIGGCAKAWPPADVTGTPTVGVGLDQTKVGAAAQADGTMQLTYGGHLLYRYAEDVTAGQTNGQGEAKLWFAVNAAGAQAGS